MSTPISKRKLEDYADDALFTLNPVRMRKDHPSSSNSAVSRRPVARRLRSSTVDNSAAGTFNRLQFFVRILSDHTLVLEADSSDTIYAIHEKIHAIYGIPIMEQRLIYRGKQLQWDQTLAKCEVQNDASLNLVGRMRSTGHPQAWQLMNEIVSLVLFLCRSNLPRPADVVCAQGIPPQKTVKSMLTAFLSMTPRMDSDQASDHLQIFNTSSAPAALVMLYMSSHKPNKDAADDFIKHFVISSKTILPKHCYHHFAPIVLEFCRLLNRAAGIDDQLYGVCRSVLGATVEHDEIWEKKGLITLRDIFSFFLEVTSQLSRVLTSNMVSNSNPGPSTVEVSDFSAFLVPVKSAFRENIEFCGPIKIPLEGVFFHRPMSHGVEISILHTIFGDVLKKLEQCLSRIEEGIVKKQNDDALPGGARQYLPILKELNSISKLYYGCEEVFWDAMKRRKIALCYVIVKYAERKVDHKWLLECKEIINFEARRHLAMLLLPEVKDDYEDMHEMLIDRSHLLIESFEYIARADTDSLRAGLFMEFKNEEASGPGVLREWFFLVCQAIFNPQNALFVACPNDRRRFFPNPASKVDPLHLEYFNFCGRVIALALMHNIQVGIVFDRVFFSQLSGNKITLEDVKDADPDLYSSWKQILEMDPEVIDQDALGLTFVHEIEELGTRKIIELCPGGKSISLNSKNRKEYVNSLIHQRFVVATTEQVSHFAQGFTDIVSCKQNQKSFFQFLDPEDLDRMLHGSESEISVDDWKTHTDYRGFKETDDQITWFWKVVGDMTADQKKVLLFFWTSIKYLPVEGFSGLASRLCIYRTVEPVDRLPSSHTCFYRLCFPAYPSVSAMHDRLSIIVQEHVGCSFGTW